MKIKIMKMIKRKSTIKSRNYSAALPLSYSRVELRLISPMSIRTIRCSRSFPARISSSVSFALATKTSRPAAHSTRGTMGDIEEPAAILQGVLAVPLGDVEGDRGGCPVQLVFDLADSHASFQKRRQPCNESDRFLIDFQLFMIEPAFVSRGHGVLILILILLLIVFVILIVILTLLHFRDVTRHCSIATYRRSQEVPW